MFYLSWILQVFKFNWIRYVSNSTGYKLANEIDNSLRRNQNASIRTLVLNLIYRYTRCITPKGATSWRAYLRVIAPAGNTAPFEMSQRWRAVGKAVSDLTCPSVRFDLRPPAPETNALPLDQLAGLLWL